VDAAEYQGPPWIEFWDGCQGREAFFCVGIEMPEVVWLEWRKKISEANRT